MWLKKRKKQTEEQENTEKEEKISAKQKQKAWEKSDTASTLDLDE